MRLLSRRGPAELGRWLHKFAHEIGGCCRIWRHHFTCLLQGCQQIQYWQKRQIYIYIQYNMKHINTLTLHFDMHWSQNTVLYNDWRIKRLTLLGTYTHFIHTSYVLFPRVSHQRVLQCLAEPAMKEVKHRQSVAKQERKRPGHRRFGRKFGRSQQLVFGWEIYRWGDHCICTPSTCNWVSVCIERFVADKVVAKHGSCQKAWTL